MNKYEVTIKNIKTGELEKKHCYGNDAPTVWRCNAEKYQGRAVESLSAKELKTVLKVNNVADKELSGVDKSELQISLTTFILK